MISSGIAIGVTGKFGSAVEGNTTLVPLNITDFKHEQTICMYYKKENDHGNTAKFISFLRESIAAEGLHIDLL